MAITEGALVSFEYTLTDDAGEQIESNAGKEPLQYTHGQGQMIPGVEKGLEGMKAGESKKITVNPEDGYGVIEDEAFVEVPKEQLPEEALVVGAGVQTMDQSGQPMHAIVSEVKDETVTLNFNHPLAGKTLHFDVNVLEVTTPEEKS